MTSFTIGGVAATLVPGSDIDVEDNPGIEVREVLLPTGTTTDVVINFTDSTWGGAISLFSYTNGTLSVLATASDQGQSLDLSGNVPAGADLLAITGHFGGSQVSSVTWTGLDTVVFNPGGSSQQIIRDSTTDAFASHAYELNASAGTPRTISLSLNATPAINGTTGVLLKLE